ncbi:Alpha/beta hydrolase OS=Lysinibacillus sphaericus OX=1421 GN=LS41612_12570 PE=4 SV=1 [Lysinibacillus sphaericus]
MLQKVQLKNGETMAYRKRDGGNQTLLCIHGNMTSSKHWDVLLVSLDTNYTIYAIDLRGFGGSSYHQPIHAIQDFSDDVKLFVDAIDLDHFDMIGWSHRRSSMHAVCCKLSGLLSTADFISFRFDKGVSIL